MELVHPHGLAARSSNEDLFISFHPTADYAGIAKAAAGKRFGKLEGKLYTATVSTADELKTALVEAVKEVSVGRGACVEVVLADESPIGQVKDEDNDVVMKNAREEEAGAAG